MIHATTNKSDVNRDRLSVLPPSPVRDRKTIVVVGNGMVGLRFCEKLVEFDTTRMYRVVTFCEEPRAAYDRVGLTTFFAHRDAEKLMLARQEWYQEQGIELHIADRACSIDRNRQLVRSEKGVEIAYDFVVLATGSFPFVPPVPGIDKRGVFVYRTIEDLERIIDFARQSRRCAVLGGGLLGLEAARAAHELGLETHVVEFSQRLMPRQIDETGSKTLVKRIESMGVRVHLGMSSKEVHGNGVVERLEFADGQSLDLDMIIVSAGIRPRDDLGKESGLTMGQRGGVLVDDLLRTSDPAIFAIGECASHRGMVYGLVGPGYEMAEVVAANLTGGDQAFSGTDLSTKLKLMGCDVASFGDYEAPSERATPLTFEDPFAGIYKKLVFSLDGSRLLGGILVGDASAYGVYTMMTKSDAPLPCRPHELLVGSSGGPALGTPDSIADAAQVCSCNNVSKGQICAAIRKHHLDSVAAVKEHTRAGTGCGGCVPMLTDIFHAELKKCGQAVSNHLCEHFALSRTELFGLIKIKQLRTFDAVLSDCGQGNGCETCKPAV
ncbi:MAG TPA: nitrite reductase large subunit NirB, partial [Pirellulales bacterium]|nr:nitrite reductase large subunit NirB [Pirellulales bacterium]